MSFRKIFLLIVQGAISAGLLGYLGYQAWQEDTFSHLAAAPRDWTLLAAAWFVALIGVVLTLLRWWVLVQALDLPLSPRDALRIGFVAYFINLLGAGVVGGDALKAVYLGRRTHGRRAEAMTTIVLDRVLGLYVLICISAIGLYAFRLKGTEETTQVVERVGRAAQICGTIGTVGLLLLFSPGLAEARLWDKLARVPLAGGIFKQLVAAARMYRRKYWHLLGVLLMSVVIHSLFVLVFYLLAGGLNMQRPSLATHFVIVPPAMAAGTLPIGTQEAVFDALYRAALPSAGRQGFVLILAYRLIQILISGVGIGFYLAGRKEVDRLLESPDVLPGESVGG